MNRHNTLADQRAALLDVARAAIVGGIGGIRPPPPAETAHAEALRRRQASFVTLTGSDASLRGCCGSVEPRDSLLVDLHENAWRTAFGDPRFEPVTQRELAELHIAVSLLSPLRPLPVDSRDDLLARLEPQRDGLLLVAGDRRATFLPKVWDSLPEPRDFVAELLRKAGWSGWPDEVAAFVYSTENFAGAVLDSGSTMA